MSTSLLKITVTIFKGAFVPLTVEGNLIVDGVLASCYQDVPHDLAHMAMTPIRLFPSILSGFLEMKMDSQFLLKLLKTRAE